MPKASFFREISPNPFPWERKLKPLANRILKNHKCVGDVNIVLCTDKTIRSLNREYRKLDKITDVISMEWHTPELLGEIYIAEEQVKRQANRYGVSYYQELRRMVIHGTLHLAGFDHLNPADRLIMRNQEEYYRMIQLPNSL